MKEHAQPAPGSHPPLNYLTKRQLADRLSVSIRTINTLMRQRKLPWIRFSSRLVRFPAAAVDAYINANLRVNARGE